jgi:hypothetical protein
MNIVDTKLKQYTFLTPPKPVGWWQITPDINGGWSTRFAVYAPLEPKHIKNTEEMFGWKYLEAEKEE